MEQYQLQYLFRRYFDNTDTPEERQALMQLLSTPAVDTEFKNQMDSMWQELRTDYVLTEEDKEQLIQTILQKAGAVVVRQPKVRKNNFRWWRYAAAILILAIGSWVYYFNTNHSKSGESGESEVRTLGDVAPGTNRAVLTINNNQNIDLSSNKTGININNAITYNDGEKIADAGQLLQLTTPRGGQYQAVLPDGSKVWLNAASSIKFPSKFSDKKRAVEITGEVYFEIARNKQQPFIVKTRSDEITVLGTAFNINSYRDEPAVKTSLSEGSIKVNTHLLQPGEMYTDGRVAKADLEQDLAWKNGVFNFNNITIQQAMRQLARWYDVDIVYDQPVTGVLIGKIGRNLTLSQALKILDGLDVHLKLEGRTLHVQP